MRITYDAAKRARTFEDRGLDFDDAAIVFSMRKANAREEARIAPLLEI